MDAFDAILALPMQRHAAHGLLLIIALLILAAYSCISWPDSPPVHAASNEVVVELTPFNVDAKNPERRQFGAVRLVSAFQLRSKDKRFGGLSGLAVGRDGRLYAVSDRGYWLSARIETDESNALVNLLDWRIAPMLTPARTPVNGQLRDAEALAQTRDGSLLVGFEGAHRIWRYDPPPHALESTAIAVPIPAGTERAPRNGGIEGLTVLPDGRLLILTEQFDNPDGSTKGWLAHGNQSAEVSYLPAEGFRVTDCAALANGDVLVLERRYVPFGILSARMTLVQAENIQPGAKLAGKELLRLEQPLATENFEGMAVTRVAGGTAIYLVSDDNFSFFQQTLLLQFFLPDAGQSRR
jgi:hypothetical protein